MWVGSCPAVDQLENHVAALALRQPDRDSASRIVAETPPLWTTSPTYDRHNHSASSSVHFLFVSRSNCPRDIGKLLEIQNALSESTLYPRHFHRHSQQSAKYHTRIYQSLSGTRTFNLMVVSYPIEIMVIERDNLYGVRRLK